MQAKPGVFSFPVRVYWEDTDAGGIVFYANYLKFFERARTEWLRSLGLEQHALKESSGGMFVVSQTNLHYRAPARLDDLLHVTAFVSEMGRSRMIIEQQALLFSEHGSTLLCEGSIRLGWVDVATLRPARMPDSLQKALPSL
jgi:acyl-CoA thioester hydrolase